MSADIKEGDLPKPPEFEIFHPSIKGVFSQWHLSPFGIGGERFGVAEQWRGLNA